mmetsp:Transcript_68522/g.164555  ORF Transcript_68522/g.164555 Transcript_68522/m.164555 type:complete len:274 (+) Transcript_68522:61-882(+)
MQPHRPASLDGGGDPVLDALRRYRQAAGETYTDNSTPSRPASWPRIDDKESAPVTAQTRGGRGKDSYDDDPTGFLALGRCGPMPTDVSALESQVPESAVSEYEPVFAIPHCGGAPGTDFDSYAASKFQSAAPSTVAPSAFQSTASVDDYGRNVGCQWGNAFPEWLSVLFQRGQSIAPRRGDVLHALGCGQKSAIFSAIGSTFGSTFSVAGEGGAAPIAPQKAPAAPEGSSAADFAVPNPSNPAFDLPSHPRTSTVRKSKGGMDTIPEYPQMYN